MEDGLKRNFSRVQWSRTVRYRDDSTTLFRSAQVHDLSIGGMAIHVDTPYPVGTKVYLQFMLENGEIVAEGYARVAHHDSINGMGLEFVSIDEKFIAFTQLVVSEELIQGRFAR